MGQKPAPDVANIVMATLDVLIKDCARKLFTTTTAVKFYKRFLDDIFMIFKGSCSDLHKFLKHVNMLHPSLKFTMEHSKTKNNCDCDCKPLTKIPFLDTQCEIEDGKIIVDLYKKPTDRNMYLLTSSCHPSSVTENIPYSLALRIVRICSKPEARDLRLEELKQLLLDRNYKLKIINAAISKAKNVSRSEALKRVVRPPTNRPVFPVTHHPSLPSIPQIVNKHYRALIQNPTMAETFKNAPMVAYKRPRNIKDYLVKTKLPPPATRPKRILPGMHKCNRRRTCLICPYIKEGRRFKSNFSSKSVEINRHHTCEAQNCIHLIQCKKCNQQYIGEAKNFYIWTLKHIGDARNCRDNAIGEHFNSPGHSMSA